MDPMSYFLGFSRLAPVQCVSIGHPDTTGLDKIDYFVSAGFYEPLDGDQYYTERLIRLPNAGVPAFYHRPTSKIKPSGNMRTKLGLMSSAHIYLCPQSLFKFHPDFDEIIARILSLDSDGILICVEAHIPWWTHKLQSRFKQTLGQNASRVIFLPRQVGKNWPQLLADADVILDTPHFSGMSTTLDALSVGTPVVTLQGQFMRGRQSSGIYTKMGFTECIAGNSDEYVSLAVAIATDGERRRHFSEAIAERVDLVFAQEQSVTDFEQFLVNAIELAR